MSERTGIRSSHYLIDDRGQTYAFSVETVARLIAWGKAMEVQRRVARVVTANGYRVSTVFLGTDHGYDNGEPILFETMIFGGKFSGIDEYQERCSTLAEAAEQHLRAVNIALAEPEDGGERDDASQGPSSKVDD